MQLLIFNEEFLVSAIHQIALITSLPFVHTARRSYRLNGAVRRSDGLGSAVRCAPCPEVRRTLPFRGRRSRNKVSVGEPAEGSLPNASLRRVLRTRAPLASPSPLLLCLRGRGAGAAPYPALTAAWRARRRSRLLGRAAGAKRIQPRTRDAPRRGRGTKGSRRLAHPERKRPSQEPTDNSQQRISWLPQR